MCDGNQDIIDVEVAEKSMDLLFDQAIKKLKADPTGRSCFADEINAGSHIIRVGIIPNPNYQRVSDGNQKAQ